ncbi:MULTISPECIES: potassium transporter Trk [unclassified Microbacterium]|uniref:potassium transporter Trk n=1 Tax=unclassified Microbacterium TaxID=2609290 RepID=UPI003745913C
MAPEPEFSSLPSVTDEVETLRVRRAPKYAVFLILGAALGVLAAMILTLSFNGTSEVSPNTGMSYSSLQVFGFLALICIPLGMVVGAVIALVLDRTVGRRTRDVVVDHERVELPD